MLPTFDRALLSQYLRPQWLRAISLGLLLLAGIGLQLANPQIVGAFINSAQSGQPLQRLISIALLFVIVALLTQVATVAQTYVAEDLGWRTTNVLRADLTRHVLGLDADFHAQHTPGELIERIDGDVSAIADFFASFVVQVLGSAIFLFGVLILMYLADWRVGATLTLFSLLALIFMTRAGGFVSVRARADRQSAADLTGFVEERLTGMPDIKSSGADAYVMRRLHERLAARFRCALAATRAGAVFEGSIQVIFALGTGAALGVSAALHGTGAMTLGTIYIVFRYTGMLRLPLELLSLQMNNLQQAAGGAIRVRELLDAGAQIKDGPGAEFPDEPLSIELDRVSFAYDELPILRDVSFRVEPGEILGLLGRTGSGKTTISRLLFRLHDPAHGVVRLGGVDIRTAHIDALRDRVGLVTQDVQLFEGSLRDNVSLFDPAVSGARLEEVFEHLSLGEWLRELPDGLDTLLGPKARDVSAGEAQLITLARVFLKDPGLVVLDEASSRLDPQTERLLEQAVTRLLAGRTGLIIAHRLPTVERADKILVLEQGRVVEFGVRAVLARDPDSRFSQLKRAGMSELLA